MSHISKYTEQRKQIRMKRKLLENLERMQGSLTKLSCILEPIDEPKYSNIELICRASSELGELQFSMSKCESVMSPIHKQVKKHIGATL